MPMRVLIMEDDVNLLRLYSKAFRSALCWVDQARTLHEARLLLRENDYAVFVVDMVMGKEFGVDILREMGDKLKAAGTQLIVVSAEEQFYGEAAALGVQHFLAKPVLPNSLVRIVEDIRKSSR